jgi:hypothetical protein
MSELSKGAERSGPVHTESKAEKGPNFTGSTKEFVKDAVERGHGEGKDNDKKSAQRGKRNGFSNDDPLDVENVNDVA